MFRRSSFVVFMLLVLSTSLSDAKQPNILFIFADDQCFDGLRHRAPQVSSHFETVRAVTHYFSRVFSGVRVLPLR